MSYLLAIAPDATLADAVLTALATTPWAGMPFVAQAPGAAWPARRPAAVLTPDGPHLPGLLARCAAARVPVAVLTASAAADAERLLAAGAAWVAAWPASSSEPGRDAGYRPGSPPPRDRAGAESPARY